MTAYRVVDDHKELENVGSLTHDQLDSHVNSTPFLIVSGVIGSIPPSARLLSGSGITITDGGPGGTLTLTAVGGGGSGTPGGNDTEIQFNDGGFFGGDPNFTFDKVTNTLTVENLSGSLTKLSDGSSYLVAGNNISISTGSNGQITISSTATATLITYTSWMEVPSGEADGTNSAFTLTYNPTPVNALMFFVNGVLQRQGVGHDYILSGNTITSLYAPNSGSNLTATYTYQLAPVVGNNTTWMEVPGGVIDGANSVFTLSSPPQPASALMFYVNGVLQRQGVGLDYTLSSNVITTVYPLAVGSNISATYPY